MAQSLDDWVNDLDSWFPWRRRAAVEALAQAEDHERAATCLLYALRDRNAGVRAAAALGLRRVGDVRAVVPLAGLLGDRDPEVRAAAAWTLAGKRQVRDAASLLRRLLGMEEGARWDPALEEIASPGEPHVPLLARALPLSAEMREGVQGALDAAVDHLLSGVTDAIRSEPYLAALQDLADPRSIGPLIRVLALRQVGSGGTRPLQEDAYRALQATGREEIALPLARVLVTGEMPAGADNDTIASLLGWCGPAAVDALVQVLEPGRLPRYGRAAAALGQLAPQVLGETALRLAGGSPSGAATLGMLASADHPLRWRVIDAWAEMPAAVSSLQPLLRHRLRWVRVWAAEALGRRRDTLALLRACYDETEADDPFPAAVGLAHLGVPRGVRVLAEALTSEDREVRLAAVRALLELGRKAGGALAALYCARDVESDPEIREECQRTIRSIENALRGGSTELEAAQAPAGTGSELEAAAAEGRGTELEAAPTRPSGRRAGPAGA